MLVESSEMQLAIAINFTSSKDIDEEHTMHSKGDNIEVMNCDGANEVIEEIFESLFSRYQIGLKKQRETMILSLIVLIWCITTVIKEVLNTIVHKLVKEKNNNKSELWWW